jgi:hypothetical protein
MTAMLRGSEPTILWFIGGGSDRCDTSSGSKTLNVVTEKALDVKIFFPENFPLKDF